MFLIWESLVKEFLLTSEWILVTSTAVFCALLDVSLFLSLCAFCLFVSRPFTLLIQIIHLNQIIKKKNWLLYERPFIRFHFPKSTFRKHCLILLTNILWSTAKISIWEYQTKTTSWLCFSLKLLCLIASNSSSHISHHSDDAANSDPALTHSQSLSDTRNTDETFTQPNSHVNVLNRPGWWSLTHTHCCIGVCRAGCGVSYPLISALLYKTHRLQKW